ncbi:MAG: Ig-like domain-containing protein [Clostridia bacterium]|nr:Ig-like domain-containing protein [Clostridia bacterium]
MKRSSLKGLLAGIVVLAILISCVLPGLVLPAAAADVTYSTPTLQLPNLWIMTGRYRTMGNSTLKDSAGTTVSVAPEQMTWSIADTGVATVDATGKVTPVKVGVTTLTGAFPAEYKDTSGNTLSKTIDLHVVDGSDYVYFNPDYTLGSNVVPNGDFANDLSSWYMRTNPNADPSPATTDYTATGGKDGTGGLQFKSGASWRNTTSLGGVVKAGTNYVFSFDYLAAPGNSFELYGGNLDIPTKVFTFGDSADGQWHTYTRMFQMPYIDAGTRYIYFNVKTVNAANPVVIDNVSLCEYHSELEYSEFFLNHAEKKLMVGQTQRLEALTEPFGGDLSGITWSTSNDEVATVKNTNGTLPSNSEIIGYGLVTAVGVGTATITATLPSGLTATCEISVSAPSGAQVLKEECNKADKSIWKSVANANVRFNTTGGKDGSSALLVGRTQPVRRVFTGLEPNTTYTLQGFADLPANSYFVVTLINGEQVLTTLKEQYNGEWDTAASGEPTQLSSGFKFTTPATLESDTTELHIAVLKAEDDTAATVVGSSAAGSADGKVDQGEGEVTDEEDDISVNYQAVVDSISIFEPAVEGVDLTPTYVQWKGDTNNDGQVTPGTQITFQVPVKNVGANDLPAGEAFDIAIAANGEVIRTITYDGGIAVGETVLVTDTAAWTATAGDYMISARVNASLKINETNLTTNQTYQLNLRVANDIYTPAYNSDIIAQAGMDRLTMSDDFTDLSAVDTLASGNEGYKWYVTRPWSGDRLTPYDYMVNDGVLTLMNEVSTYGIGFNSVDVKTNNGYRYKHGYLEVRLRIVRPSPNDDHESGVPTVWSFTEDKALENITGNDTHWVELDWLEYWGNTNQYPGGYYTTTFHQSTTVDADPSYSNSNHSLQALGDAEWHVMGWLWENNKIRTFVDGVEMMNLFIDKDAPLVPGARVNKEDENGNPVGKSNDIGLFSWANMEEAVLYLGGSKDNPHEIDYVRIWQTGEPETVSDNMTIDKTEITLAERSREFLNVTVPDGEDAGTLTWASSDPAVVTVHGNGELYARGNGKAVVTATNANGISVMSTVTVTHNLFTGGDCEETNDLLHKAWGNLLSNSNYQIVDDGTGNHVYKMPYSASAVYYYNSWPVKKNTTYVLSGRYKGPNNMYAFVHGSYCSGTNGTTIGDISLGTGGSSGWKSFSIEFTTKDVSMNSYYIFGFRNKYGNSSLTRKDCYLDDLVLVEKNKASQSTYTLTVDEMTNGSVTLTANGSPISSGASLAPGTYVDVKVTPNSGYQLKLGSLEYAYALPTFNGTNAHTREVLNKNNTNFGVDTANTFRFVMPAEDTTLSALFEQVADAAQTPLATLGTSVYIKNETDISGVRFLNRLYYSRLDGDDLYVMYNGAEHKVTQFGSLLKRSTNEGELTLAAYDEHKNDSGATRIWKHTAYAGQNINVHDYTNSYMDFTITMTSSVANRYAFLNRGYTICAYMVLEDGTVVYGDAFTDSVLNAYTRYTYAAA